MKTLKKTVALVLAISCLVLLCSSCGKKAGTKIEVTHVTIAGEGITDNTLSIMPGEEVTLSASVSPSDATNKTVTWASSNKSAADISTDGKLTAVAEGSAEITATADGKSATLAVTVIKGVTLTAISFTKPEVSINVGSSSKLVLEYEPSDATDKDIIYTITPDSGAVDGKVTISALGKVDILSGAKGGSSYTITATSKKNSAIKTTCKVSVLEVALTALGVRRNSEAVDITSSTSNRLEIPIDLQKDVCFFVPNYTPTNTSDQEVTYSSSDSSILQIQQYENLAVYSVGPSAKVGDTVDITVKGQNDKKVVIYAKIGAAKNYLADDLTAEYLNSLTTDTRASWNIEQSGSSGNYDTAGTAPLSQAIWRGTKSSTTYGGVSPWDGVWGIIFDSWDNPYKDNELANQYMYNKVSLSSNANFAEFRVRTHTTATTSVNGKFKISILEADGNGGFKAPVILKKVKGISQADSNGWMEISNCAASDLETGKDYFVFDISAYKSKTVVFLFEVDDMGDKGLKAGTRDSGLCDRICFLGAEVQEAMVDRTSSGS